MPALLEAENLEAQYGWTKVLHGLSFAVEAGGITTILGRSEERRVGKECRL